MMMKIDFSVNVNHLFYINMISYMIDKINSHILYKDQTVQIVRCKLIKITTGNSLCD